ncbi:hypothetical protein RZS08_27690, partial [Arthrospira platensis SPKY1]|nr:hypothetical protein [Arthrospira platensis SPKY1]
MWRSRTHRAASRVGGGAILDVAGSWCGSGQWGRVSVTRLASGRHATRIGVYGFVPSPADT